MATNPSDQIGKEDHSCGTPMEYIAWKGDVKPANTSQGMYTQPIEGGETKRISVTVIL